jgi:hypothetical protein
MTNFGPPLSISPNGTGFSAATFRVSDLGSAMNAWSAAAAFAAATGSVIRASCVNAMNES